MKINGYEIVINVLSDNLTPQEAIGRMAHNLREPKQAKKIRYLRRDSKSNKYYVQSPFGALVDMSQTQTTHDNIEKLIKEKLSKFKADYEKQKITDKNGKAKKRAWQKKMTPFTEIILSFGTQRKKGGNEGLNKEESDFVNALDIFSHANKFINEYCNKYGVECIAACEHNDEKTKHWQIIFENYDYVNHTCIRRNKTQMSKYGKELQDMGADAFKNIAVRGIRGSKAIHQNLKQMHKTEISYENEKALKNEIDSSVQEYVNENFEKVNPLIGESYYKISKDGMSEFTKTISEVIYDAAEENITILQAPELKEQIDELEKQLASKSEVFAQNKELEANNELLLKENSELKELNAKFSDKEIIISQQNEIKELKEAIKQKDIVVKEFENKISSDEKILEQAQTNETEMKRLRYIEGQKINIEIQNKYIEEEKAKLETQINIYKKQADKAKILNKKREKTLYKLKNATKINRTIQKEKQKLEEENKRLKEENALLKAFKDKVVNFFKSVANKIPAIKEFIYDNAPEIKGEVFERRDMGIEID
ncbi:hypothetical protein [Campylobacter showae]|jgi:hypothetical protein|uniref:hypothetical protein n=1 Tax=Campylobacter showae TaxID=204 RepID=UPI0028D45D60|nr:hypothetical protein [Campylobacter showae]